MVGTGSESVGRPLLLVTTRKFLDQVGLSDLSGLPTLRDIAEILNDPGFNRERARLFSVHGLDPSDEGPQTSS